MSDLEWWYLLIAACALVAFIWLVVRLLDRGRSSGWAAMLAPAGADTIDPVEEEDRLAAFKSSKPLSPGGELKSATRPQGLWQPGPLQSLGRAGSRWRVTSNARLNLL